MVIDTLLIRDIILDMTDRLLLPGAFMIQHAGCVKYIRCWYEPSMTGTSYLAGINVGHIVCENHGEISAVYPLDDFLSKFAIALLHVASL